MTLFYAGYVVIPLLALAASLGAMAGVLIGYRMGRQAEREARRARKSADLVVQITADAGPFTKAMFEASAAFAALTRRRGMGRPDITSATIFPASGRLPE
jgi:membrane protein DedA with SNARE-associated domain